MPSSVLRFAPSPNGRLHLGHARSALLNAAVARRLGARLLLRIEDIDPERSKPAFEAAIREDLAWLGIRFDDARWRQSEHMERYRDALAELKDRGLAYPCFCSRGEVKAAVAAQGAAWPRDPDGAPLYPGTCRALTPATVARRRAAGEPHVVRLDMPRALAEIGLALSWTEFDPAAPADRSRDRTIATEPAAWGDTVVGRKDVPTSYHLAVVLDDAAQGVTHVVRGQDLFAATAVHRVLQALSGLPPPLYHHHPLIHDPEGRKLAKSAGSTSLADLRAAGWTPQDVRRATGVED